MNDHERDPSHRLAAGGQAEEEIRRLLLRLLRLVAAEVAKALTGKETEPTDPSGGIARPVADSVRFDASSDGPTSEEVNPTEEPMSS